MESPKFIRENPEFRTHLVDGSSFGSIRETSSNDDLPSRRLSSSSLKNVTEVKVLNLIGFDIRSGKDSLDGSYTELDSGNFGEASLE